MIKISFWLKKFGSEQSNLEYITFGSPKKILKGKLVGMYACEVYLSDKKLTSPIYAYNPIDSVYSASEFLKMYLQGLINRGYEISEVKSKELWKLEKVDVKEVARERINKFETLLKDDKSVSAKTKQELLTNLRKLGGIEKNS